MWWGTSGRLARVGRLRPLADNTVMRKIPDLVAELRALLRAFSEAGVDYALCGGLAANIYGADRFTKDIDLLIAPDDLDAALGIARSCGFTIDAGLLPLEEGARAMHRVVKLEAGWEDALQLDLMIADGGSYAEAYESRYPVTHEGLEIWLVAREELIEMKRESDRPIDQQDVERLS